MTKLVADISTHEKAVANRIGDVTANFSASSKEVLGVGMSLLINYRMLMKREISAKREGEYFENR
ncbi:hypothetical protein ACPCXF_02825 [Lysinibacillus agricola]